MVYRVSDKSGFFYTIILWLGKTIRLFFLIQAIHLHATEVRYNKDKKVARNVDFFPFAEDGNRAAVCSQHHPAVWGLCNGHLEHAQHLTEHSVLQGGILVITITISFLHLPMLNFFVLFTSPSLLPRMYSYLVYCLLNFINPFFLFRNALLVSFFSLVLRGIQ